MQHSGRAEGEWKFRWKADSERVLFNHGTFFYGELSLAEGRGEGKWEMPENIGFWSFLNRKGAVLNAF